MPINSFLNYNLTWRPDKTQLTRPYSVCLFEMLKHDITYHILKPGTRLPPQRELADFLDISFASVTRAYNLCKEAGLIFGETGRGTFVSEGVEDLLSTLKEDKYRISMNIDIHISDLFPDEADDAFIKISKNLFKKNTLNNLMNHYDQFILDNEKEIVANWMKEWNINASKENMAAFSNYNSAITTTLMTAFKEKDKILINEYSGTEFIAAAKILHLNIVSVKADEEGLIPEDIKLKCANEKINGIILQHNYSGITDSWYSDERMIEIESIIKKNNLICIEFDMLSCMNLDSNPTRFAITSLPEQCFFIEEFGMQITASAVICPPKYISKMLTLERSYAIRPPMMEFTILSELYSSGLYKEIAEKKAKAVSKYNEIANKYFKDKRYTNHVSFYHWYNIPLEMDIKKLENKYRSLGLPLYGSFHFLTAPKEEKHFVLIGFSSATPLETFDKLMKSLSDEIESYKK